MTQMLHFNYDQVIPVQYYEKFSLFVSYFQKVTILDYCAFYGSLECFKILISNGNLKINKNLAVFAAAGGNLEIFKMIDLNEMNKKSIQINNEHCLSAAIAFHRQQIIEYLIEYKIINIQEIFTVESMKNSTNIFRTFFQYSNFVALIYFLKRGIDPILFLEAAASCGFSPAVRFIINNYNDENQKEFLNEIVKIRNPLHYACLSGNEETVKILLNSNLFDINDKINKGNIFFI